MVLVSANLTHLVLISKKDHPFNFNHFQPIILCTFSYKVVVKIIATKSKVLGKIISTNPKAFIKGKWIAENYCSRRGRKD